MRNQLIALTLVITVFVTGIHYTERSLNPDPSIWQVSPTFTMFNTTLRGNPEQIGVTAGAMEAGVSGQYQWYFWNQEQSLFGQPFQVMATNRKSAKQHLVFEGNIALPNRRPGMGPPRVIRTPSTFSLPTKGIWRLEAVVDGRKLGSVVVEVF
jgi:hypothetical protein